MTSAVAVNLNRKTQEDEYVGRESVSYPILGGYTQIQSRMLIATFKKEMTFRTMHPGGSSEDEQCIVD